MRINAYGFVGLVVASALLVSVIAPFSAPKVDAASTGSSFRLLGTRKTAKACYVRIEVNNKTGALRNYQRLVSPTPGIGSELEVRPAVFVQSGKTVFETKFTRSVSGAKYLVLLDMWLAPTYQVAGGLCSASQLPVQPNPWFRKS